MSEPNGNLRDLPLFVRAEMALREAVAGAIEDHRRTGDPLVIWRDGKVVLVSAEELIPSPKAQD
jgi:hypothetical protein